MQNEPASPAENEIISVAVAEDVKSSDGMAGPGPIPADEVPALMRYVKWEGKVGRPVTPADIERVIDDARVLGELCRTQTGVYSGANAVAHNQIDQTDPLRFFVASSGEIIINPEIVNHTKAPVESIEACTSFPENPPRKLNRYHRITATFQQLTTNRELSEPTTENFSGLEAKVFQHELAHLNGHCIYDDVISSEDALTPAADPR